MKIFLRVLGYSGLGLIVFAYLLSHSLINNIVALGVTLVIVAVVEMIIKY